MSSERVVVSLKSYIGDAVLAAPLLDALANAGYKLTVVTSPLVGDLLRSPARPFEFLASRPLSKPLDPARHAKNLRRIGADKILLVNRSFRSALAARLAGIPVRVGHATEGRSVLLTTSVPYDQSQPEVDSYLDLARATGVDAPSKPPSLHLSEEERADGLQLLQGALVGIQPGARHPEKRIPYPVTAQIVNLIQAKGFQVAMLGGDDEHDAGNQVEQLLNKPAINLIGKTSIRETMAAAAGLRLMIGSDTGMMHLAAGVDCPTITVFGPNPAEKWGHLYPPHVVLSAPGEDIRNVDAQALKCAVLNAIERM